MYHVVRVDTEEGLEKLLSSSKYRKLQVKHLLSAATNGYVYYTVVFYGLLEEEQK